MSELKPILQWVTIVNRDEQPEITHQFDEEENQVNISHVLDLAETGELAVLIALPVKQRLGEDDPVGNPFIAVDMKTGLINVNGTNWNFVPNNIDPLTIKFRPIWYHSVIKDYDASSNRELGQRISLYKIGWQFTHDEMNYQRIVFFDTQTGIFSLKEKR
jgi:hypothetical protein